MKKFFTFLFAALMSVSMFGKTVTEDITLDQAIWGWGYNCSLSINNDVMTCTLTGEWGAVATGWNDPVKDLSGWDKIVVVVDYMSGCDGEWFKLKAYLRDIDHKDVEAGQMEATLGLDAEDNQQHNLVIDLTQGSNGCDLTKAGVLAIQCQPNGAIFKISRVYLEKEAAPVEPLMKTIYCKMDKAWWKADGAAVGCYTWNDGGEPKVAWPGERMTPVEGETDIWSIELDINTYHMCIFTRVNGEGDVADWGAKTSDLLIPTDENDMFTITNDDPSWGDPGCVGVWSKYEKAAPAVEREVTKVGINFPTANCPADNNIEMAGTFAEGTMWMEKIIATGWFVSYEFVNAAEDDTFKFRDKTNNNMVLCQYIPANAVAEGKWVQAIFTFGNYWSDDTWKGTPCKLIEFDLSDGSVYAWKEGMPEPDPDTAVEDVAAGTKAVKVIRDGQLLIEKNGKTYNVMGAEVR